MAKSFPVGGGLLSKPKGWVRAVDGVSFAMRRGEIFGLVGESGCGKTTLGRLLIRLIDPTAGRIEFMGQDITQLTRSRMRVLRQRMQIIFQDPYSSLDPRMNVEQIVTEPLRASSRMSRSQRRRVAAEILDKVGLRSEALSKYPHEFSGGQRQRIGIARSLIVHPDLIVADEPVSALDVSIQAQVINLLLDLKAEFDLSYIFISHDLSVVEHICDRVAVMYLGTMVEIGRSEDFVLFPFHPYTKTLLAAVPQPDPRNRVSPPAMDGGVPNPIDPPPGCPFHPRCPEVRDICRVERPVLKEVSPDHFAACWLE